MKTQSSQSRPEVEKPLIIIQEVKAAALSGALVQCRSLDVRVTGQRLGILTQTNLFIGCLNAPVAARVSFALGVNIALAIL